MNSVRVGEGGLREWRIRRESNVSKRKKRLEHELADAAQPTQGELVKASWGTLRRATRAVAWLLHRALTSLQGDSLNRL